MILYLHTDDMKLIRTLTGSQGPLHVRTVAWNTKKLESGILNA